MVRTVAENAFDFEVVSWTDVYFFEKYFVIVVCTLSLSDFYHIYLIYLTYTLYMATSAY